MVIKNHIPIYHIIKINLYAYKWWLQQFHRFNKERVQISKRISIRLLLGSYNQ